MDASLPTARDTGRNESDIDVARIEIVRVYYGFRMKPEDSIRFP